MVAEPVLMGVRRYLQVLQQEGVSVRFAVVFGSQVGGTATEHSDIDLVVVSPKFDGPRRREDVNQLWRIAARTDSRIEPIPCGEVQWLEDDSSTLIEVARRQGQRVDPVG